MNPVRFGILGAARIAPTALLRPARASAGAVVEAVAARDRGRAESFARRHAIPDVATSYEEVIADPGIDAVYIPLPNSLHAAWTTKAVQAGKHVLCEKPFASNATEAAAVAEVAAGSGVVVMEAFHYRYHPLTARLVEIVASGELGEIRSIETRLCVPFVKKGDIRYRLDLSGGATMDVGCYTIHLLRTLAGAEPTVRSARAKLSSPGVDRWMQAEFDFADGRTGRITCSLFSADLLSTGAKVTGTRGSLTVFNPTSPQLFHRIRVTTPDGKRTERCDRRATYAYQLDAFVAAVRSGAPVLTPPSDSLATMAVIDAVYEAAGLPLRGAGQVA